MTDDQPIADCRAGIDRRLEAALETERGGRTPLARAAVEESGDRWYGRLLVVAHASVAGSIDSGPVDPESVRAAAAAVELLRGYCRIRRELLDRTADADVGTATREPTAALLAGDILYSAAYSAVGRVDDAAAGACFETLTNVSGTVVDAFDAHYGRASPTGDRRALVDGTAGALGRGAVVLGATLAGVEGDRSDGFATLGRGLAVGRRIRRTLDPERGGGSAATAEPDDRRLRQHATRRLAEAERARRRLPPVADSARFRPLFEDIEGVADRSGEP